MTTTYPTLEQAVEAARQEWVKCQEHWRYCTDSHDPDPHQAALKAIAAAYVAVVKLPLDDTDRHIILDNWLGGAYISVAEATP